MKYSNDILKKYVILEDYLPLTIKASTMATNAEYLIYRHGENSLLEFVFDATTHMVHKICMVICKDYEKIDAEYTLSANHIVGDILVETPDDVTTDIFRCEIYTNAVKIKLSNLCPERTIVSDNLVWELDANGNLLSLAIYNQSSNVINHTFEELSYDSN